MYSGSLHLYSDHPMYCTARCCVLTGRRRLRAGAPGGMALNRFGGSQAKTEAAAAEASAAEEQRVRQTYESSKEFAKAMRRSALFTSSASGRSL
eukprot:731581-Pyramimonas_sp.AAC.1